MSGYENAPATKLLATHCCVCARALVDAKSVEMGIGPDCRRKYGFNMDVSEVDRIRANHLVYQAAANKDNPAIVATLADELKALGFEMLAARIIERVCPVIIEEKNGALHVTTPYQAEATDAWRRIPGRFFHKEEKVNVVPVSQRGALWTLLKVFFPGLTGMGPKGPFVVA